jgi:hypothetical protein
MPGSACLAKGNLGKDRTQCGAKRSACSFDSRFTFQPLENPSRFESWDRGLPCPLSIERPRVFRLHPGYIDQVTEERGL